MPRRSTHVHPCEGLPPPARPIVLQQPLQGCSSHARRLRRRTGGGSLLRRQARHGRRRVFARWHRVAGYRLELPPRTVRALAPRSEPPTQQRFVVRLRSASAVNPHPDSCKGVWPRRGQQLPVREGHCNINPSAKCCWRGQVQRCTAGSWRVRRGGAILRGTGTPPGCDT